LTDPLIPVTKTTSDVVIIPTIPETSTVYYITIIDDKTCVSATAKEVKAEVIQLKISPDKLPVYAHDVPYSVQLTTNAETPVFSPAGNLITGISMSSEGLISGTVPESVGHEQFHFTVTVTDKNSCQDTKDYILKTCARVPEESNVSYCQNATASPLPTSSAEGFPLQWYDADLNKLDEAPTPNTSVVGEQIFYVSHINEQEDCESGRSEIRVTINPLPEHTFDAPDVNVCSGSYPVINLSNLNSAYTYSIYADAQLTDLLTPVSETTSGVVMIPTIPETSTVYYITTTDDKTCVSSTAKAVKAEVIQLEILPDKLPIYIHDVPYSVQLTTNAESPVFTTDNFVEGITLSSSGLISGVIPASVGHDKLPFIVTVTDQNLCRTSNKYVIHSCSALPETSELLISYCKGTTAVPLEASSAEGFPLQWYDENFTKLTEAPIPNTSLVGEQKFYVSQINEAEQCESGHTEIRVTITALPENTFDAPAVNVCFGSSPVISLSNLNSLYSYAIYADAQLTDRLASTTGKTSDEVTLPTVPATSTEYYIQMADDLGCVAETPVEVKTTVISLEILPERLPVFKTDVPYSVQLTSNAESPTYSYTGDLVTGITMTSEGLISGMVSESSLDEQSVFSVTVNDVNGCLATRGYTLISCVSPPQFSDQTVYCESVPAEALQAVSVEGNSLQWYDAELNQLGTAPVPNTSIVGEQRFYVTQIDATKGCESEMTEVLITVNPAPSIEFADSIAPVCFGGSPVVKLNNLREDYTYSVYSDNEMSYERGSLTGVNSGQILIDDILESDTTYYIRVKDVLGCPSTDRTTIPVTVVKLYIQPDTLPSYAIRKPYEQILLSNAERAMFSVSEGSVPAGLMLDVSGRISGEVSSSIYGDDNTFTVEVRDRNGCTAHQRYTLVGGIYIPEIFTPNGDGINDVFMPENKVVIFDRLGIEMYRGNHGWDGTHKGKFVAEDIYFFILEYIDPFGKTVQVQGYVGVLY
jgi:gliding motility-associated-like protein